MAHRTLDLTLISAKDLNNVNLISNMEVYAVASIDGDPRTQQRTPTDRDGGRNPAWNSTLRFAVPVADPARHVLHILLRCQRALGDRDVGELRIPIKELLDGSNAGSQFVSYQVRKPSSGKPKGVLNLSFKFSDAPAQPAGNPYAAAVPPPAMGPKVGEAVTAYPAAYPPPAKASKADEPVTAYPAGGSSAGASYPPPGVAAGYGQPYAAPYGAPPQAGYGYPPQPPQAGYGYPPQPPQAGYGYPPAGYGAAPPPPGYGYGAPAGYGYAGQPQRPKKNKFGGMGMGLGAGLLGGALGGMLIGDMVSDAGDYDAGYDAGFDDGGGFDF